MKKIIITINVLLSTLIMVACGNGEQSQNTPTELPVQKGQSAVQDNESAKDIVKIAISSKDHTTLVTALQAAELVDVLSNAGPFTVFAPVNDAFAALPKGTVDGLLKPEKKADLQNILQYHVAVAVYNPTMFNDGQIIEMVNGGKCTIHIRGGKTFINDAEIMGNVKATNGIVYVINKVLLPQ
ncbi:MAG: fasciclin domain-containing protein [Bacteroidia bacterium]|nr:fasciclin domain-containing protein [Bacteroidia bacterium]